MGVADNIANVMISLNPDKISPYFALQNIQKFSSR